MPAGREVARPKLDRLVGKPDRFRGFAGPIVGLAGGDQRRGELGANVGAFGMNANGLPQVLQRLGIVLPLQREQAEIGVDVLVAIGAHSQGARPEGLGIAPGHAQLPAQDAQADRRRRAGETQTQGRARSPA